MNLALLLPIGLAALAALLVPLMLHLARRSEERVVVFAALRWLQSKPQPRRKRRFDEMLLLSLRLLLLAALALLLAEPVLYGQPDRRPWIAVAPGVVPATLPAVADARWHWLSPGFPRIEPPTPGKQPATPEAAPPGTGAASLSSLLRQLDAELPAGTPLTLFVPSMLDGVDAERPRLSRQVDWQVVTATPAPATEVAAIATAQPMQLMVRHGPGQAGALRYLRAAGAAWRAGAIDAPGATPPATVRKASVDIAPTAQPIDPRQRNLVWLVPGPLPADIEDWIVRGGTALLGAQVPLPALDAAAVLWRDDSGPLVRGMRLGKGRVMRLERALLPAQMPLLLESDFPARLQALFAAPPPPPARVAARDHRPRTGLAPYPEAPRPLAPWLAMLVAVLFLAERWVANGPRRRQAA